MNRRVFLTSSTAAAVGLALSSVRGVAAESKSPIRLGGPIFTMSNDPVALAREHRRLGYCAAYCPEIATLSDSKLLSEIRRLLPER